MALKDKYLTISQAAKELKVTRQTISRWIAKKYVTVERVGRVALIKKEDLYKYHRRKLSEAAADSIIELYTATVADIFREEGRMPPSTHVEFAEDGDDNAIQLSDEERAEVSRRLRPILEEMIKELNIKVKDIPSEDNQQNNKRRRKTTK